MEAAALVSDALWAAREMANRISAGLVKHRGWFLAAEK